MEDNKKKEWQDARFRQPYEDIDSITRGHARTTLQNLAARYRRFSTISFIMIFTMPWVFRSRLFSQEVSLFIGIGGMLYFLICFAMDLWLYRGVSRIDCARMSVSEVAHLALYYRKRHIQFLFVLLPLALAWVGAVIYFTFSDINIIWCMLCGVVIGLAIGIRQLFKFLDDYRELTD